MRAVMLVLAIVLLSPLATIARQATPTPDTLFPTAADLGHDWVRQSLFELPLDRYPYLDRFAGAGYLGPNGSRALVGYHDIAAGPKAAYEAWGEFSGLVDLYGLSFVIDEAIQDDLDDMPPVSGCTDMRRLQGEDPVYSIVTDSISLCGVDTDVIIFAYVSGSLDGLEGHQASDRLVELVLESSELP